MAVRVRKSGRILCAAMFEEEPGDIYIDDGLHYTLSVELKLLMSQDMDKGHSETGEWWWRGHVPDGIVVSDFYTKEESNG